MRGRFIVLLVAVAVVMAFAGSVSADPADNNPNAFTFTFYCRDGAVHDMTIPNVFNGSGSPAALEFEGKGNLAVSKSLYVFGSAGDAEAGPESGVEIWAGPPGIRDHNKITWCWWNPFDGDTWIGNHLLFVKK